MRFHRKSLCLLKILNFCSVEKLGNFCLLYVRKFVFQWDDSKATLHKETKYKKRGEGGWGRASDSKIIRKKSFLSIFKRKDHYNSKNSQLWSYDLLKKYIFRAEIKSLTIQRVLYGLFFKSKIKFKTYF